MPETLEAIDFTAATGPVAEQPLVPTTSAPALPLEPATILSIIDRAARDPNVDIEKMDRLLKMKERMEAQQARIEYDAAMSAAQEEMEPVRANCFNKQTQSQYANYYALDEVIRPIYTKNGFSLSFDSGKDAPENCVDVVCCVAHRGGHREYPHLPMPADGKGAKGGDVMTRTHATGAAITYGKRYLLGMVFNLSISFDDDGNGATARKPEARAPFAGNSLGQAARDAIADGMTTNGETRSTYDVEKIKRARDGGWIVTNKTPKGRKDQLYDYLDMAETVEDVEAIINHNTQAIAESGEASRISANADKIAQYLAEQAED